MEDCSTAKRLRQETVCRWQRRDEYVEHPESIMRQNIIVVWIQCLLVDVVCHTGTLAPDHVGIFLPNLWPYKWCAHGPSASEVGKAPGWCDWTSMTRISAWRLHSILTRLAEEGMQEYLSRLPYQNPAEKVEARLPLTGEQISSQIGGYFVGGVKWRNRRAWFSNMRPCRHVGI